MIFDFFVDLTKRSDTSLCVLSWFVFHLPSSSLHHRHVNLIGSILLGWLKSTDRLSSSQVVPVTLLCPIWHSQRQQGKLWCIFPWLCCSTSSSFSSFELLP
jgi:hypothetical protein